ncbi:MAG: UvrD-helicase domain-containing protein [Candidatus Marinimicrobia bacterium]|nr:UvrD-helicase domain-containing protein [Candidatus Neomarinimicrobiota bacterium]
MELKHLNATQREAVECVDSPVLIFAGAGSGKTRVLIHKIAYLVKEVGLAPESILAVTFTNKAAREMHNRVDSLLNGNELESLPTNGTSWSRLRDGGRNVNLGTFHSTCARILRKDGHLLGYRRDFVIYDKDDQLRLIKQVLVENDYDLDLYPPQYFLAAISRAKNKLVRADQMEAESQGADGALVVAVYQDYQQALKNNHAVDFDDLLMLPLDLFDQFPKVLEYYRQSFKYVLVDEYQDTNRAQFEFIKRLTEKHRQICVVGDDDQSIYSWRGADITNILNFSQVFQDAKVFKLEQNYRSTTVILAAANAVVERNKNRAPKTLWTARKGGEKLQIFPAANEREEAEIVLHRIQDEILVGKRRFRDMVILFRTNAQSRALEDMLRRGNITYNLVGGTKFYDRKEIKDVLAYLRLLVNPSDSISLERVINFPPRAIGETSMNRLRVFARERKLDLFEALDHGDEAGIQPKQAQAMQAFKALIGRYRDLAGSPALEGRKIEVVEEYTRGKSTRRSQRLSLSELAITFLEAVEMIAHYKRQETADAPERLENINELVSSIEDFSHANEGARLGDFLEEVSLLSDVDRWSDDTNAVTMMTLHSAKGLEFPVVFITGLEEGLFPLNRLDGDGCDEEEERRLFYVGLTRARDKAYLTYATSRRRWGTSEHGTVISRFLRELPEESVIWHHGGPSKPDHDEKNLSLTAVKASRRRKSRELAVRSVLDDFVVGSQVEHKLFGVGKIRQREGVGDNLKLTVEFEGGISKKLVAKYAHLTRL